MPIDWTKPLFITGTTVSSMTAGGMLWNSLMSVPAMVETAPNPKALATQWRAMFLRGLRLAPPSGIIGAASYFACAYLHHHPQLPQRSTNFILAGLATIGIVPFTMLALNSTNSKLLGFAEAYSEGKLDDAQGPEVEKAVKWWGTMNLVRGFLPLIGTLLAFEAL